MSRIRELAQTIRDADLYCRRTVGECCGLETCPAFCEKEDCRIPELHSDLVKAILEEEEDETSSSC